MRQTLAIPAATAMLAAGASGDEPRWSSPDTRVGMTYAPKVGDEVVVGYPRVYPVGTTGMARQIAYEYRRSRPRWSPP